MMFFMKSFVEIAEDVGLEYSDGTVSKFPGARPLFPPLFVVSLVYQLHRQDDICTSLTGYRR